MVDKTIAEKMEAGLAEMLRQREIIDHAPRILRYSLLSSPRLKGMIRACDAANDVPGITAEIGCASGGTSRLIALLNGGRTHYACDTFEGLVDVSSKDARLKNGDFNNHESQLEGVKDRAADLPNQVTIKGYFPESAPDEMRSATYALAHIDTDTYLSMRNCFEFFWRRMAKGGIIVMDDVIGRGTEGGKRFWKEAQAAYTGFTVLEENDPHVIIRVHG